MSEYLAFRIYEKMPPHFATWPLGYTIVLAGFCRLSFWISGPAARPERPGRGVQGHFRDCRPIAAVRSRAYSAAAEFRGESVIEFLRASGRRAGYSAPMADVEDEGVVVKEDQAEVRNKYRICEITKTGERGRPRRNQIIAWEDLTDEELKETRRVNEPRLRPNQIAELNGRTVARGGEVTASEVEASEPPPTVESVRVENPFEVVEFARRVSWDLYQRDAEATARLRDEAHQLTRHALEQGKQVLELIEQLKAQAQRPAPPPQGRPLSLEDISKLIQVGASAVGEIMRQRPEK